MSDEDRLQVYLEASPSGEGTVRGIGWLSEQAAFLEQRMAEDGPLLITPELFWCLITPQAQPVNAVIEALKQFVAPYLDYSQLPEEMWAWVANEEPWRLTFFASLPHQSGWTDGEHLHLLEGLDEYCLVTHDHEQEWYELNALKGGEESSFQFIDGEFCGAEDDPNRTDVANPVWAWLDRKMGLTLERVQRAIARGEPRWVVCDGQLVQRTDS